MRYAKRRGEEQGIRMHGVLHKGLPSSSPPEGKGKGGNRRGEEICLSSSEYGWRAELISKLTSQLQMQSGRIGLMEDMGSMAGAYLRNNAKSEYSFFLMESIYVAALEQSDLMRIAWHLCEIFYWSVPNSELGSGLGIGSINTNAGSGMITAPLVVEWAYSSLDPIVIDDIDAVLSSPEHFWSYVHQLLIRGDIKQAIGVLGSSYHTEAQTVALLLHKMPTLYSIQGTSNQRCANFS